MNNSNSNNNNDKAIDFYSFKELYQLMKDSPNHLNIYSIEIVRKGKFRF